MSFIIWQLAVKRNVITLIPYSICTSFRNIRIYWIVSKYETDERINQQSIPDHKGYEYAASVEYVIPSSF